MAVRLKCLFVLLSALSSVHCTYKLCVLNEFEFHTIASQCSILKESGANIECISAVDKMDCLQQVIKGVADFGVFDAEELLIAAEHDQFQEVFITHRLHPDTTEDWEFGVVAVISNTAGITDLHKLRGKKLCHPGYNPLASRYDWSNVFSMYFENRVVEPVCQDDLPLEENRIKALSEFFGDSCKPGAWSPVHQTDAQLKAKYSKLCKSCDIPSSCSSADKYWGRQGALFCLSDCVGDVAWARLDDAIFHFQSDLAVCGDVSLLCPDGKVMPLNSEKPCLWIARPNAVIAANRNKAQGVQHTLFSVFNSTIDTSTEKQQSALLKILGVHSSPIILPLTNARDYLEKIPGYLSANTMERCRQNYHTIRLCTEQDERHAKCEWLAVTAKGFGIKPTISCTRSTDCLQSVANNASDVVIIDTDQLATAVSEFKLEPLLVQTTQRAKDAESVSAVVKSHSDINSLADLRGKNACFTSFNGHGWNALASALRDANLLEPICPLSQAVSRFFAGICFTDQKLGQLPYTNMMHCSAMGNFVSNETIEPFLQPRHQDKDSLVFQCLANGGGDVAVMSMETIKKYTEKLIPDALWAAGLQAQDYRSVCQENSTTGCILSWSSMGQVMVNQEISQVKRADIISVFTSLDNVFGNVNSPSHHTFEIFSKYEDVFSIEDDAQITRLEMFAQFKEKASSRPKNYDIQLHNTTRCYTKSAAYIQYSNVHLLLSAVLLWFTISCH